MANDSLGDRMKGNYENRTRMMLPRRAFTVLRADGKAFSSFTRHCDKPYDLNIVAAMDAALLALCREAQGAFFGYVQSDEISVVCADFMTIGTEAWFDGNLQKIVSVGASVVTYEFNHFIVGTPGRALFDCRAFSIADPVEVENYLIWRQQDATRNSIQGLAQAHFSAKRLHGVTNPQAQELLMTEKNINWNDRPTGDKRGRCAIYVEGEGWTLDSEIPVFTADRDYIKSRIPVRLD